MRIHGVFLAKLGAGVSGALLISLLTGTTAVSAAGFQRCPGVEYWEALGAKGTSCATAHEVRDAAMDKVWASHSGLPIDWKGRVGGWTCTYKNVGGPGRLKCVKGSKQVRWGHAA